MIKIDDPEKIFNEYVSSPTPRKPDFVVLFILLAIAGLCWTYYIPLSATTQYTEEIELGYTAKQDEQGNYYVVDSGHTRLICFDENSSIKFLLSDVSDGESHELYIDDFAVDNGLTYISASEWDGMMLSKEVILVFDKENFIRTVTSRDYTDTLINKHRFYGITVSGNVLRYVEAAKAALAIHSLDMETGEDQIWRIDYHDAYNAVSDCVFHGDALYVLDKSGSIVSIANGKVEQVYSTEWPNETRRIPYRMAISRDGKIYFTDIRGRATVLVDVAAKSTKNVFEPTDSLTVNLTSSDDGLLLVDQDGMHVIADADTKSFLTLNDNDHQVLVKSIYAVAITILAMLLLLTVYRIYIIVSNNKPFATRMIALSMSAVVFATSATTCKMQIDQFSETYIKEIMSKLENSAYVLANQIPLDILDKISNAEDFNSKEYEQLCRVMEKSFPMDVEMNRQVYCNIMRLDKDTGTAYSIAWLDRSIGVYFPLSDPDEVEEVKQLYQEIDAPKMLWNMGISDASGNYISLKIPLHANGEVKGVISLGTDASFIQSIIKETATTIFFSTVVILMLVQLGISEAVAWFEGKQIFNKAVAKGKRNALPSHFIRLLIFTIFICVNLTSTFLPVWILHNSGAFEGADLELMASLPFTVNIFVMGVMSLVTPTLIKKLGMGHILTLSSIAALYGNFVMFLIPGSYPIIFFGLIMDGIGVGLITNATYVLLTYIKDEDDRQQGFNVYNIASLTGSNFGMMLGSILAVLLSQRATFLVVALIWLSLMVMSNVILWQLKNLLDSGNQEDDEDSSDGISFNRFIFNKPVTSFIVLIQNPYILFNGFIFFFMPMFCESHGYSEIIVSILMMLYSEAAVQSDEHLSARMENLKGHKGMYAAYFLNVAAVLLFALMNNLAGMIVALVILGIAAGFGKPLQQTWFLKQKPVQLYGEDKAMGVYNFTENIGESLGPMVFSKIMVMEPLIASVSAFCAAVAASGASHMLLNKKELTANDDDVKEGDA